MNTNVLLVFPGQMVSTLQEMANVRLPLSTLCLAAYLRKHNIGSRILDLRIDTVETLRTADLEGVNVVGFSCMTGQQIRFSLETATYLRSRLPNALFVWGGIHPTLHLEETAVHPLVDVAVDSEGEQTLLEIVQAHNSGRDVSGIPGTVVHRNGELITGPKRPFIDMNELPLPAYDLVNIDRYPHCLDNFDYQTSRGCPFKCTFCYNLEFNNRSWRAPIADKTVDELEHLVKTYGVRRFAFVDDEFFIKVKRAERIYDLILERGLKLQWSASCRLDLCRRSTDEYMQKLKASGCSKLYFGGESGSEEMLVTIQKAIKVRDILEGVQKCIDNDVTPIVSFMAGTPGETSKQFNETLALISRLWEMDPRVTVNGIFPYSPYPGTPMFEDAKKAGLTVPDTLDGWGQWAFQYHPDHPWLSAWQQKRIRVAFYMVRFRYHLKEFNRRYKKQLAYRSLVNLVTLPMRWSASLRWRSRAFSAPLEWDLWALIMGKTFGYL